MQLLSSWQLSKLASVPLQKQQLGIISQNLSLLVKARGQVDRTLQLAPIRSESKETCLSVAKYLQTQDRRERGANENICGECARTARIPRRDIVCSHTGWSHAKCLQLSKSTFKYYLQHQEIEWTCYIKHQQCTKQITEIKERLVSNAFAILSVQETKIDRSFPNIQFHVNDYNLFL